MHLVLFSNLQSIANNRQLPPTIISDIYLSEVPINLSDPPDRYLQS